MDDSDPAGKVSRDVAARAAEPPHRSGRGAAVAAGGLSAGWVTPRHAAAQVDLPGDAGPPAASPDELEQAARAGGHGKRLDRARLAVDRPADPAARALGRPTPTRARRCCSSCTARGSDLGRSAFRIEQMRELGFSVLAVDYRGFGSSTDELPSETGVVEDAAAAWRWLGRASPGPARATSSAIRSAARSRCSSRRGSPTRARASAPQGVIVEGTFTSIGDMFGTFKWGWLPISMLITERFDSLAAVPRIKAPLLVVHGSDDSLVPVALRPGCSTSAPPSPSASS